MIIINSDKYDITVSESRNSHGESEYIAVACEEEDS